MEHQQFEPNTLAYIRVTGPYGENYEPASQALYGWAGQVGLAEGQCLFIYWDNPEITPPEKCRTDICITVPEQTTTPEGIEIQPFPGGEYAVVRKVIEDKAEYPKAWQALISEMMPIADFEQRPCFELYHNYDVETQVADVSFCAPVKE